MKMYVCELVVLLAVVFALGVPVGAVDLHFTFEEPTYATGSIAFQDGWYPEETEPTPTITDVAPLAGSQSMFISRPGYTSPYQRAWHSTADQIFTDVTNYQFIAKVESGAILTGLWNTSGKQFWGMKFDVDQNLFKFFYGYDCGTIVDVVDCWAGNKYLVKAKLDFANHIIRTKVENLTNPSQPLVDSGDLAMDPGTTATNAAAGSQYTGMRFIGGGVNGAAESRIDEIGFNLIPVSLPGSLAGHVDLENFGGSNWLVPIGIELIPKGSGTALTKRIYLDGSNNYVLNDVDAGVYDVVFTSCKWLRKVVTSKTVTSNNTTPCDVSLVNGDVDGDNEVTSTDLSVALTNIH
jgi:hypothetical protein